MSTAPLPPIPPIIAQLTGPLLLGHFFNWGLFGALTVQTWLVRPFAVVMLGVSSDYREMYIMMMQEPHVYYLAFPNDRKLPKAVVGFTYTIELLQTILSTRDAFRNFGTGWGNMNELDAVGWLWFSVPVLGSIISCTSQLFYAWRIYILSKRIWLSGIVSLLALVQCGFGIFSGAFSHIIGRFSEVQVHAYRTSIVWLGGTALCDVILTACMIYYLHKSNTGFRATTTLLSKFIRITVETGLTCATFAILDLALFLAFEQNNYHLAPSIALSKIYANSLLVVFNARARFVGGRNATDTSNNIHLSSMGSTLTSQHINEASRKPDDPIAVTIPQSQVNDDFEVRKMLPNNAVRYVDNDTLKVRED